MIRLKNIKELALGKLGEGRARVGGAVTLKPMLFLYFCRKGKISFPPYPSKILTGIPGTKDR